MNVCERRHLHRPGAHPPVSIRDRMCVILALASALAAPVASDEAACEAHLAVYYTDHAAPHEIAAAYAASKAAFDHVNRQAHKVSLAAFRFSDEAPATIDTQSRITIIEVSQAMSAAAEAASEAIDAAETARALWAALEAGETSHSTLEALNIEHAAFMTAIHFDRVGEKSLEAAISAIAAVALRSGSGKYLDVLEAVIDANSMEGFFESLAGFEEGDTVGIAKVIGALKAFQEAGHAAGISAKEAAVTLEIGASAAVCRNSQ